MSATNLVHLTWLKKMDEVITTKDGKEIQLWELNYQNTDFILSKWATHFRNHYCLDSEIDSLRNGTGYTKKEYLENLIFPDKTERPGPSIRSGDFCEILVADFIEFVLKYWVPRTRYASKTSRNESVKGCDVIGFKIVDTNPSQNELVIFESKAQISRPTRNSLQEAIKGSSKDNLRKAVSLNAIKRRFKERHLDEEANKVEKFQNPTDHPYKELYGAAAVISSDIYNQQTINETDSSSHPNQENLVLILIRANDLKKLIDLIYDRSANEA